MSTRTMSYSHKQYKKEQSRNISVFILATIIALLIFPGIDIGTWHLLSPSTFWEKIGSIGVLWVIAGVTFWGALLAWSGILTVFTTINN